MKKLELCIAEPILHPNENLVEVHYQIFIKDKARHTVEELQETHRMRYLFKPEVNLLFTVFGFEFVDCREWITNQSPGCDTWSVYFLARRCEA